MQIYYIRSGQRCDKLSVLVAYSRCLERSEYTRAYIVFPQDSLLALCDLQLRVVC